MRRTLVVLALLFAVVMSDNEKDNSQWMCEKEVAASDKCWKECETKYSGKEERLHCLYDECNAIFEAEAACETV